MDASLALVDIAVLFWAVLLTHLECRLRESASSSTTTTVVNASNIMWDDMDYKKYYLWNITFFTGVRVLVYPPILVKTRLQVQTRRDQYKGMIDALIKIPRQEGIRGLYKGLGTLMLGLLPSQMIYITTLELFRARTLLPKNYEWSRDLLAGAVASATSSLFSVPLDVVTQRLMIQDGVTHATKYRGGIDAVQMIVKEESFFALYRGFFASFVTYAPSSGIWWAVYGRAKPWLYGALQPETRAGAALIDGLSGTVAAAVAATSTNWLDVTKTRLQVTQRAKTEARPTWLAAFRSLYQQEGLLGFMKGLSARITTFSLVSSLMVVTYEQTKKLSLKEGRLGNREK